MLNDIQSFFDSAILGLIGVVEFEKVLEDYHKAKMQEKKEYLENIYKNAKDEKNRENQ